MTQTRRTGHIRLGKDRISDLLFAAMSVLATIASQTTLDAAFAWLCKRRRDYPAHADVWAFRRDWPEEKARLRSDLLAGLAVARETIRKFVERATWLYEQEQSLRGNADLLGPYLRRWTAWLQAGLEVRVPTNLGGLPLAPRHPSQAQKAGQE